MDQCNYLQHTGVKGMKWGHRKAQEPSNFAKRRASKQYKKLVDKTLADTNKKIMDRTVNAYNKTADEYNNGKIEKFNKTHNPKSSKYLEKYEKQFNEDVNKTYNKMYVNDLIQNPNFKKAQQLSEKYNMTSYDTFVKNNIDSVKELQKTFG